MTASLPIPMLNDFLAQLDGAEVSRTRRSLFDIVTHDIVWGPKPSIHTSSGVTTLVFTGEQSEPELTLGDVFSASFPLRWKPSVRAEFEIDTKDESWALGPIGGKLRLSIKETHGLITEVTARTTVGHGSALVTISCVRREWRFPVIGYPHPITAGDELTLRLSTFDYSGSSTTSPFEKLVDGHIYCALVALHLAIDWHSKQLQKLPRTIRAVGKKLLPRLRELHERREAIPRRTGVRTSLRLAD
ncbi:MAG TPA: hypothetical protein VN495_00370 [Candidatus Paceibacterota bacterium]|nr:hypothetical protein [Candidatus Paceibacterota bacterium]